MSSTPLPDWYPDPSGAPPQRHWEGWIGHKPHAPAPHRTGLWIALSIIALLVLFFGGCTALIAANPHTPATAIKDRGGPGAPPGTPIRDGKFEFVLSDVGTPKALRTDPQPRGQWIVATITVRNLDSGAQEFHVDHQKLIDSDGHTYAADTQAAVAMNKSSMVIQLTPNSNTTMKLPFDVPTGTLPTTIELHDSVFSEGARVQVS